MNDPLMHALAHAKEEQFKATCLARALEVLGARFDTLPERKRPFYTPRQRFQVLEIKNLLAWPAGQTARLFRVCTSTIHNWDKHADPAAKTGAATVRQAPPITRFADAVRSTVHLMADFGFGSDETTSLVLARFVHRVWMMDVTQIEGFLGGTLYLASVFDAFSRVPLVLQTYHDRPGASAMAKCLFRSL